MTSYARQERARLADALLAAGPDAPTLCTGWTARDLAAHLVVRERRPDTALGMVIPPLAGHGEHVRKQKAAEPFEKVVEEFRRPPWWSPTSNPLVHDAANSGEFFIHHEDVRRGAEGWAPRELDAAEQQQLWRFAKFGARLALRKLHAPVLVRAPGLGELSVGSGDPVATLTGSPSELVMFVSGRQRAARVEIEGSPEVVERLRTGRFGI